MAKLTHLGKMLTNENLIRIETKTKLKFGNNCYQSVQNLFPSRLLSKQAA
jgi:hypothetical protein